MFIKKSSYYEPRIGNSRLGQFIYVHFHHLHWASDTDDIDFCLYKNRHTQELRSVNDDVIWIKDNVE